MGSGEHITWGARTLSGVDRFGRWLVTDGLENWWGSPDTRGETEYFPDGDGELDLPVYNQARLLTLQGHLHSSGHDLLHEAGHFLTSSFFGRFKVQGHGPTLWADGKRNSGFIFNPVTDTFAQWQVRIKFNNPRKYGDTRTWTASVGSNALNIFHRGNYNATPRFVVTGAMPGGYRLTIKGVVFTVTQPLVSGQPHSIDFGTGRLRVNGNIVAGGLGWGFKPLVTPGVPTALAIEPITTGTGSVTLTLTDTYI
ncbi:hypothetical protein [Paenarthrobacter ureafaciens]|uniref:hypothetical protein n=1 Tax=Paenarthrobacter ureafaciens TaxID=37931 RepID=UPI001FB41361|nr:hypothetical protein [Paenarthrobacter ureafaciens]UOD80357.1 hypothetical protein MQZ73_14710 [Paenarthrobacter ureafaciens]WNZ03010.1 hypothetical protein PVT25_15350 [Paenarthrobacter ureafaciens]